MEDHMIDTTTHKPLSVSRDGNAWPYIIVPVGQLDQIKSLLDANAVSYWVDEEVLSLDGKPEIAFINLGRQTDPAMVQQLLDSIP
jgi:hypothetical protein